MKTYFAYIRVSTTRQGEEGVSLQEQRSTILEYATQRGMAVAEWFEEQVSASKHGRPVFTRLVGLLKARRAAGLIIHKIDRGSRNLRDWADLGELMDRGIEVHFAHESIDLHTRSGRLSADILAVVASDYIRNLREETLKGINGRLRQGLFPFAAPVGYINNGSGKMKTVDPVRGPLVELAFKLYASREYSLKRLKEELFQRGFRTKTGKAVHITQLATILRNPFYMGLIRLRNRKDTFAGIHPPLVTSSLYNEVQFILDGKRSRLKHHNCLLFRCLVRCEHCRLFLVGERQKGHVYYRCHRRACPTTCIREERFEAAVLEVVKQITIVPDEEPMIRDLLKEFKTREAEVSQMARRDLEAEHERVTQFIKTLLQRFLDNSVSKEIFDEGHTALLMQRSACEEKLGRLDTDASLLQQIQEFLARLRTLCGLFCTGSSEQRRKILDDVFQSVTASGSDIHLTPVPLMEQIAKRERTTQGWTTLLPVITKALAGA